MTRDGAMRIRKKCAKGILFFLTSLLTFPVLATQTQTDHALSNQTGYSPSAAQSNPTPSYHRGFGDLILQLGGFVSYEGSNEHVYIEGNDGDYFKVSNHSDGNYLLGLGYLINGPDEISLNNQIQFRTQYGLNAFYLPKVSVKGNLVQEQEFYDNLSFKYSVTNYPIYLTARAIFDSCSNYKLTLDLGAGPNIIRAHDFKEKSQDGGITVPDQIFSAHTKTAFSATIGVGVRIKNAFGNTPVECGYRFFYLGQGSFKAIHPDLTNTLKTGNGYANALLCSISV